MRQRLPPLVPRNRRNCTEIRVGDRFVRGMQDCQASVDRFPKERPPSSPAKTHRPVYLDLCRLHLRPKNLEHNEASPRRKASRSSISFRRAGNNTTHTSTEQRTEKRREKRILSPSLQIEPERPGWVPKHKRLAWRRRPRSSGARQRHATHVGNGVSRGNGSYHSSPHFISPQESKEATDGDLSSKNTNAPVNSKRLTHSHTCASLFTTSTPRREVSTSGRQKPMGAWPARNSISKLRCPPVRER